MQAADKAQQTADRLLRNGLLTVLLAFRV
jgi:hypothetical protein